MAYVCQSALIIAGENPSSLSRSRAGTKRDVIVALDPLDSGSTCTLSVNPMTPNAHEASGSKCCASGAVVWPGVVGVVVVVGGVVVCGEVVWPAGGAGVVVAGGVVVCGAPDVPPPASCATAKPPPSNVMNNAKAAAEAKA